jgi:hypothetical protein
VLDILLLDESSPRSLAFQLVRTESLIVELSAGAADGPRSAAERIALEALTTARLFDVAALPPAPGDGAPGSGGWDALAGLLDRQRGLLFLLAEEIQRRWFEPAELPQQMVRLA